MKFQRQLLFSDQSAIGRVAVKQIELTIDASDSGMLFRDLFIGYDNFALIGTANLGVVFGYIIDQDDVIVSGANTLQSDVVTNWLSQVYQSLANFAPLVELQLLLTNFAGGINFIIVALDTQPLLQAQNVHILAGTGAGTWLYQVVITLLLILIANSTRDGGFGLFCRAQQVLWHDPRTGQSEDLFIDADLYDLVLEGAQLDFVSNEKILAFIDFASFPVRTNDHIGIVLVILYGLAILSVCQPAQDLLDFSLPGNPLSEIEIYSIILGHSDNTSRNELILKIGPNRHE